VCMESQFYDELTPFYHLIYPDWESSIAGQARNLAGIICEFWGNQVRTILDVSCGIGTQALGLAARGYALTASDLSSRSVERAKQEAIKRGLNIEFSVADMRQVFEHYRRPFDAIIACDNSIPHLLSDSEILVAFRQFYQSTAPGGGCLISVRDYAAMDLHGTQVKPYGIRSEGESRYLIFQVWEFRDVIYDLSMYFVKDDGNMNCKTYVMRSQYYAVTTDRLIELMTSAGYENVQRLDNRFFQPVVIGTRPSEA
jgi:SAM-dependent methyltransferase